MRRKIPGGDFKLCFQFPWPSSLCRNPRKRADVMLMSGLMSYASNTVESYRHLASYVDRILKGAKRAEMPVERTMRFEFIINLKTAKQIGLTIPPNMLARADKVIR